MNFEEIWYYELFSVGSFVLTIGSILLIILIILTARGIIWLVARVLKGRLKRIKGVDPGRQYAIVSITKYFVYTLAGFLVFESVGVNVTLLIAGSTALFVGLGFGLQNTFNDFVSGIILLFEGSLQIGDVVEVKGMMGRVTRIGIRTSQIWTRDNVSIIVPNSNFVSDKVINWSHQKPKARFKMEVGVKYGSNTSLVTRLLIQSAENHPEVSKAPKPRVVFNDFGNSSLVFQLHFWTEHTFEAEYILSDIRYEVDNLFRAHGVTIPFPQRDVHLIPPGSPVEGNSDLK